MTSEPSRRTVAVWDLPVRIVHWSFVLLIPLMWWTQRSGEMEWHVRLGHVMLALLLFRIYWGFAGSATARFASFVRGPRAIVDYLTRPRAPHSKPLIGHNPLGALSVLLLLGLLVAQVGFGLFSEDTDGLVSGSLASHVSYEATRIAGDWHDSLFDLILAATAVHIAAILFYILIRRDNLVGPMISGRKAVDVEMEPPAAVPMWRLVVGIVGSAGLTWWVSLGAPF